MTIRIESGKLSIESIGISVHKQIDSANSTPYLSLDMPKYPKPGSFI